MRCVQSITRAHEPAGIEPGDEISDVVLREDYERAVQVADQALAVNLPSAWQWRSESLFMLGREAEAVRSLAFELSSWTSMSPEATAQRAVRFAERYNQDGLQECSATCCEIPPERTSRRSNRLIEQSVYEIG